MSFKLVSWIACVSLLLANQSYCCLRNDPLCTNPARDDKICKCYVVFTIPAQVNLTNLTSNPIQLIAGNGSVELYNPSLQKCMIRNINMSQEFIEELNKFYTTLVPANTVLPFYYSIINKATTLDLL